MHYGFDGWRQTLEMLEKKEKVLQKKIAMEIEKAKEFTRLKNKRGERCGWWPFCLWQEGCDAFRAGSR